VIDMRIYVDCMSTSTAIDLAFESNPSIRNKDCVLKEEEYLVVKVRDDEELADVAQFLVSVAVLGESRVMMETDPEDGVVEMKQYDPESIRDILLLMTSAQIATKKRNVEGLRSLLKPFPKMISYIVFEAAHRTTTISSIISAASHLSVHHSRSDRTGDDINPGLKCVDDLRLLSTASLTVPRIQMERLEILLEDRGVSTEAEAVRCLRMYLYFAVCWSVPSKTLVRSLSLQGSEVLTPVDCFGDLESCICSGLSDETVKVTYDMDTVRMVGLADYIFDEDARERERRQAREDADMSYVTPEELFRAQIASGRVGLRISNEIHEYPDLPLSSEKSSCSMQCFPPSCAKTKAIMFIKAVILGDPLGKLSVNERLLDEGEDPIETANRMLRSILRGFVNHPDKLEKFRELHRVHASGLRPS